MRWAVGVIGLVLAGCGTPQEQCIAANTRDLGVVDRLIRETQGNLDRGYALERVTEYRPRWTRCEMPATVENPDPVPEMCWDDFPQTVSRPKAVDLAAEAATLKGLQAKRRSLSQAAQGVVAQCKALHPE